LDELIQVYQASIKEAYPVNKEEPWQCSEPIKQEFENTVKIINNMKLLLKLR